VGKMVLFALEQKRELNQLSLKEMKGFTKKISKDVYDWIDPVLSVKRRNLPGGTGPDAVKKALEKAKEEIQS